MAICGPGSDLTAVGVYGDPSDMEAELEAEGYSLVDDETILVYGMNWFVITPSSEAANRIVGIIGGAIFHP